MKCYEDKLVKLLELCCDVTNKANVLDIDVDKEIDALMKKILTVSHAAIAADLANIRAALRPQSNTVQ
jgi:hypothetical protein